MSGPASTYSKAPSQMPASAVFEWSPFPSRVVHRATESMSWQAHGMHIYVPLQGSGIRPSPGVARVIDLLEPLPGQLQRSTGPDGGLKRADLMASSRPVLLRAGFTLGAPGALRMPATGVRGGVVEVDAFHPGAAAALTIHAGRAWTNHEAIIATLRMAAAGDVRVGIVVAPDRYKGTQAAGPITEFLQDLSAWQGVRLDLDGVVVVPY